MLIIRFEEMVWTLALRQFEDFKDFEIFENFKDFEIFKNFKDFEIFEYVTMVFET